MSSRHSLDRPMKLLQKCKSGLGDFRASLHTASMTTVDVHSLSSSMSSLESSLASFGGTEDFDFLLRGAQVVTKPESIDTAEAAKSQISDESDFDLAAPSEAAGAQLVFGEGSSCFVVSSLDDVLSSISNGDTHNKESSPGHQDDRAFTPVRSANKSQRKEIKERERPPRRCRSASAETMFEKKVTSRETKMKLEREETKERETPRRSRSAETLLEKKITSRETKMKLKRKDTKERETPRRSRSAETLFEKKVTSRETKMKLERKETKEKETPRRSRSAGTLFEKVKDRETKMKLERKRTEEREPLRRCRRASAETLFEKRVTSREPKVKLERKRTTEMETLRRFLSASAETSFEKATSRGIEMKLERKQINERETPPRRRSASAETLFDMVTTREREMKPERKQTKEREAPRRCRSAEALFEKKVVISRERGVSFRSHGDRSKECVGQIVTSSDMNRSQCQAVTHRRLSRSTIFIAESKRKNDQKCPPSLQSVSAHAGARPRARPRRPGHLSKAHSCRLLPVSSPQDFSSFKEEDDDPEE
jgi:hypothetical protein